MSIFKITILSGKSYIVISDNAQLAYDKLRQYLDYSSSILEEKELASIEVLANNVSKKGWKDVFKEIR